MISFTAGELLALQRYDVTPPRAARKAIFGCRLWLPAGNGDEYDVMESLRRPYNNNNNNNNRQLSNPPLDPPDLALSAYSLYFTRLTRYMS